MRFNAKKCYIVSINIKSTHFYQLDGHILQQVPENPYFGVTISEDLKWSSHISKITKKANSTLGFLKRNLKHCPLNCRMTAYISLIRSTLEYSSVIWDPFLQKDIDKLEKVQRQAARFISGDYISDDHGCVTQMLSDLHLPQLRDRRKANRLAFFFKVVEGLVPALQIHDYLTPDRGKRQFKTRQFKDCVTHNIIDSQTTNNCRCFKIVQCKTELFRNSFFPKTIIYWNHLEDCVVRAETVNGFRTNYHSQLSPVTFMLKGPAT